MVESIVIVLLNLMTASQQGVPLDAAVQILRRGEVRCEVTSDGALDYVGPSDAPLVACIERQPGPIRKLIITSGGGDASETIKAAELLADARPDVEVRAVCASSCANYIVPTALNLTVRPGSILALHGAADHSEAYIELLQDEVERQQRAEVPDVTEDVVREGRAYIRAVAERLIADQDRLTQRLSIQRDWFTLEAFTDEGFVAEPTAFAVPTPEFTRRQLPDVNVIQLWYPCTTADRAAVAAMMDGARLSYSSQCHHKQF